MMMTFVYTYTKMVSKRPKHTNYQFEDDIQNESNLVGRGGSTKKQIG